MKNKRLGFSPNTKESGGKRPHPTPPRLDAEQSAPGRASLLHPWRSSGARDRQVAAQASVWLSFSIPRKKVKYLPEAHRGRCGEGGGDPVTFKGDLKA